MQSFAQIRTIFGTPFALSSYRQRDLSQFKTGTETQPVRNPSRGYRTGNDSPYRFTKYAKNRYGITRGGFGTITPNIGNYPMSLNVRKIESDNSHLRYNLNVTAGQPVIEFARFGSVLVSDRIAVLAIATYLNANSEFVVNSPKTAEMAINYGLRILTQNAITAGLKKPPKTAETAESALKAHIPALFPNSGE